MLRHLPLVLLVAAAAHAAHPSLGDRRTPVRVGPTVLEGQDRAIWDRALAAVKAQETNPASNQLQAPSSLDPSDLPLEQVDWSQVKRFRIPGPANRAQEILMVLDGATNDEAQAVLEVVREVHDEQVEAGLPEDERLRARFVLSSSSALRNLDLSPEDYAKYVVIERYYSTGDVWMQDWGEIAALSLEGEDEERLAVFDSRRGRGLGRFGAALAREWGARYIEGPRAWGTKGNYGGNIEVTPDDVMVIGDAATGSLLTHFRNTGYQGRMVVVESNWLRVGHMDEYLSFLPVPDSEAGYVIVKADATQAMNIVRDIPAEAWDASLEGMVHAAFRAYPKFPGVLSSSYGVREEFEDLVALRAALTADASSRGRSLISENEKAAGIVDRNVAKLQAFLKTINGGVDVPVVSFPGLFVDDGGYRALLPGVSNLVILEGRLLIPDPLVPEMREEIRQAVEALGLVPRFVPNLTYHYMNGELHCGSIVRRDPARFIAERYRRAARFERLR